MTRAISILAVSLLACGHPASSTVDGAATVDAAPAELALVYRSRDGVAMPAVADAPVPLTFPPQGGFVLLVGVRARHLDPASVTITASLRDPGTDQVLSVEQRPVTLVADADGWASPAMPDGLFNWGNLPACPLANTPKSINAQPYVLRIAAADATGASAEARVTIVPTCEDGAAGDTCRCECRQGYHLGDPCP